jgi:hypothetical protein
MTRTLVVTCALLATALVAPARARELAGDWLASVSEKRPERLQFMMNLEPRGQHGNPFERSAFTGLTDAQIESPTRVPVEFELRREAGVVRFEGTFKGGRGAGQFTFAAHDGYASGIRSLGVEFHPKRADETHELFVLALFDVSTDFIRSMQRIGYREPLEMYQQFRIFGVDPAYVRELAEVGFQDLSAEKLVETRIHGATPEYIREMRAAGNDLSLNDYIQSRIFQVSPEFAAQMERAGYRDLEHEVLVQFRIHGVTPEFVQELREVGYTKVPAQKLVEMRIHGVTPEFIRRVEAAGYRKVPIDKLVQMRIFGIEPEMVRALDDAAKQD